MSDQLQATPPSEITETATAVLTEAAPAAEAPPTAQEAEAAAPSMESTGAAADPAEAEVESAAPEPTSPTTDEPESESAAEAVPSAAEAATEPTASPEPASKKTEETLTEAVGQAEALETASEEATDAGTAAELSSQEAASQEAASQEEVELPLDPANQTPEMLALVHAMVEKQLIDGQVIGWNKGGYHVAVGKIAAFCPVSQIEIGNPRSPKRYLDKSFKFLVIEIQKGGRRVVVSRADALKVEREALAAEVKSRLQPGSVHEGKVSSITDFGAFVDLGGGIEGLVHVSEISRKRVDHPKEILQVGQEVRVTVLKVEKGGQRISLSMKRLEEDPWKGVVDRFKPGEAFTGTILRKADFGFFVEVEPGLEGLVHTSRLPIGANLEEERFEIGSAIEGWIHEVDGKRRRLSLSLRQVATSNPWRGVEERYPEDTVIKGKVERLAPFGAFIELEPGLTGLLPFSTLGNAPANPRKMFHPGKEVSVRVLSIDREKRRISLGTETSQAEGSNVDFREYKKRQAGTSRTGLNAMAAAFAKAKVGDEVSSS